MIHTYHVYRNNEIVNRNLAKVSRKNTRTFESIYLKIRLHCVRSKRFKSQTQFIPRFIQIHFVASISVQYKYTIIFNVIQKR